MTQKFFASFLLVFTVFHTVFAQSTLSTIISEKNINDSIAASRKQQFADRYETIEISPKRKIIVDRNYSPNPVAKFLYTVNTDHPSYIKVIEKYSKNNDVAIVSRKNAGLESLTDQAAMSYKLKENGIGGYIEITLFKDVQELPRTVVAPIGGASVFWGTGTFSHIGVLMKFYADDYGKEPYMSLYGHGYTSQPNKGAKIVSNEVNALLNHAKKRGLIK